MYSLHDYSWMISDEARMGAYVRALEATVKPGSVVADIGTGTGILALVACRLGARRVYAVDTNDAVEVGYELARENGVADRIVFFKKDVREVHLPEHVDVLVSDLRGVTPLCGSHLAIIADVRARFLKPGGALIPVSDRLMIAVVDSPDLYKWAIGPTRGPYGITLEAMSRRLLQAPCVDRGSHPLTRENILSTSAAWATLDYATVQAVPVSGSGSLRATRGGIGHGLVLWFDAILSEGHGLATEPGNELCYGRYFLPWPRPTALSEGDTITVDVWAQPNGEPWGWNSVVSRAGDVRESFKQSSFLGFVGGLTPRPNCGVTADIVANSKKVA